MTAADSLGLVNQVVSSESLDQAVAEWIADLLRCSPLAIRAIKESVMRSIDIPLDQAFTERFAWEERRMVSADAVDGPRAFAEGREPVWDGY